MRRLLLLVIALCIQACTSGGQDALLPADQELVIYSTTDPELFRPVIDDFRRLHPTITIHVDELEADTLHRRFLAEAAARRPRADLLFSTAMDLQVKLVNDGYAAPHQSANGLALPRRARWRDEAFGVTFEPVVMVYNSRLMAGRPLPRSRPELNKALREDPGFWHGRIGTYDIAHSAVGYLLASQDERQSGEAVMLASLVRQAGVKTERRSSRLLDRLEQGDLALGYNLLGSYARERIRHGAPLTIVYPDDYTLAVLRTAVIPKNAPHPRAAHAFLEYLLSMRGQHALANYSHLNASRREISGPYSRVGIFEAAVGPLRPVQLGPGLLVYLDQQKRKHLLESLNTAAP
jgi:iron(III) transport system substrate-binding protein